MAAGFQFLAEHVAAVAAVGRDHEQPGVAETQERVVESVAVDNHEGQEAPIGIAPLDVELEAHDPVLELGSRVRRGLGAVALHWAIRVLGLGSVNTEEPHRVVPPGTDDLEGVAVDHLDDEGHGAGSARVAQPPPPDRGGGHDGHERHGSEGNHAGAMVSTPRCAANGLIWEALPQPVSPGR